MGVPKFQQDIMRKYGLPPTAHSSKCMATVMTASDRHWLGLSPHTPDMVAKATEVVRGMTEWAEGFCRNEFAYLGIKPDWDVVSYCDWSLRRTRSRGGRYSARTRSFEAESARPRGARISLAMAHRVPTSGSSDWSSVRFKEYAHIAEDAEIGTFHGTWEDCLRVLVLHEIAHGVQFTCSPSAAKKAGYEYTQQGAHFRLWQDIYRRLRVNFGFVGTKSPGGEEITVTSQSGAEK